MHSDEYSRQTARQNRGLDCEHCQCESGHKVSCPLINRESAEVCAQLEALGRLADTRPAPEPTVNEADVILLHGLGVCWRTYDL